MAESEQSERRVYVLPKELLERVRAYQSRSTLSSEVEAVRRLLDAALQARDTIEDVLTKLKSRYADEKDLRVLGRDVLITHPLVKELKFEDDSITFVFSGQEWGKIDNNGDTHKGGNDGYPSWKPWPTPKTSLQKPVSASSWNSKIVGDVDDEIPF